MPETPTARPPAPPHGAPGQRGRRKVRIGIVISNRMQKTIVVQVSQRVRHPKYNRVMNQRGSFLVHDEKNTAAIGDWVSIMETRPFSRRKRWRLVEILKRASTAPPVPGSETEPEAAPRTRTASAAGHAAQAGTARRSPSRPAGAGKSPKSPAPSTGQAA